MVKQIDVPVRQKGTCYTTSVLGSFAFEIKLPSHHQFRITWPSDAEHPNDEFVQTNSLFLILQHKCAGDLVSTINNFNDRSDINTCKLLADKMLYSVSIVLDALHSKEMYHRNVKLNNMVSCDCESTECTVRLIDFGAATRLQDVDDLETLPLGGTPGLTSPAMFNQYMRHDDVLAYEFSRKYDEKCAYAHRHVKKVLNAHNAWCTELFGIIQTPYITHDVQTLRDVMAMVFKTNDRLGLALAYCEVYDSIDARISKVDMDRLLQSVAPPFDGFKKTRVNPPTTTTKRHHKSRRTVTTTTSASQSRKDEETMTTISEQLGGQGGQGGQGGHRKRRRRISIARAGKRHVPKAPISSGMRDRGRSRLSSP